MCILKLLLRCDIVNFTLDDLFQVNNLVSKGRAKQAGCASGKTISEFETSLTKKLYFFPGICNFPPQRIEGLKNDDIVD